MRIHAAKNGVLVGEQHIARLWHNASEIRGLRCRKCKLTQRGYREYREPGIWQHSWSRECHAALPVDDTEEDQQ
jgi:hypothetical protein